MIARLFIEPFSLFCIQKERVEAEMKKKVLLISESMEGGLRKHVVQLIEYLDKKEFEIYFIHGTKKKRSLFC
ncbi:hypothetical protein EVI01_15910 [Enterococcus villorum]|uniref:Uncharacterized protein n=2 Tax=Enterococcus villorum TaxID=112904 RepID=A0A511J2S7_9ENTE|nr:hypothetical protein EVI01_15910 [Enterococcus villorum]